MSNKDFDNLEERSAEVKGVEKPKPAKDYLDEYYKTLGNGTQEYLGIKTGLVGLDKITLGLRGLIVLAGKAGQGKTTLALQLAFDACELGTPIIFYSLEMPRQAIFTKIINRLAEVRYSDILLKGRNYLDETSKETNLLGEETDSSGYFTKDEITRLKEAKTRLAEMSNKFYIRSLEAGEPIIDFTNLEREINLIKAEHKADKVLVVIDQLQDFEIEDFKDQYDKEGKVIREFRKINERTGATLLLVSHKNKSEWNASEMTSVKGSVDLVYKPEIVIVLDSGDEKTSKDIDNALAVFDGAVKKIDLVVVKNRYNKTGRIELDFNAEYSSFSPRQ